MKTSNLQLPLALAACALMGCGTAENKPAPQPPKAQLTDEPEQEEKEEEILLVNRDELEAMLGEERLVILDTRQEDDYVEAHIPGAIRIDSQLWRAKAHEEGGLADGAFWSGAIGELGIDHQTRVVIYGGRTPTTAARIWWHLKYAGVKQAALLDGGWELWKTGGMPVESKRRSAQPASFTAKLRSTRLATGAQVRDSLENEAWNVVVVDARSTDEFRGLERDPRGGHIPGAKHLEWKALLDVHGRFKSQEQLQTLFADVGLQPEQTIVTHCQSGGRSSVEDFALRLAGFPKVRNYYLGWSEWAPDETLPVEKVLTD